MPNDQDDGSQTPSAPTALSAEEIANLVNSAVTSHMKRFAEKQLPGLLAASIEASVKPLGEKLAAIQAAPPVEEEQKKGKKAEPTPEFLAMQQELATLKGNLVKEQEGRAAVERKAREDRAYADLRSNLQGKVKDEFADTVAKLLFYADKRVEFDADGNPLFRVTKSPYAGADPEDMALPLRSGLEEYLKSDAAKPFLPAPSGGSNASQFQKKQSSQVSTQQSKAAPNAAASDAEKLRYAMEVEQRAQNNLRR